MNSFKFCLNCSDINNLAEHLLVCSEYFIPPLSSEIDIVSYSKKIKKNGIIFEYWKEEELASLIACYFNIYETKIGFITNVSTLPKYYNNSLAKKLMNKVLKYALEKGFQRIKLEVNKENIKANTIYSNFCFKIESECNNKYLMNLLFLESINTPYCQNIEVKFLPNLSIIDVIMFNDIKKTNEIIDKFVLK